jgi:hypothetical protein
MNQLLRPYRPQRMTIEMTEQEVADMVLVSPNYHIGGLVGRRPAFCSVLAGKEFTLRADGPGPAFTYRFADAHRMMWREADGAEHEEYYEALQIDKDIYLLAYLRRGSRPATSVTCVLDLGMNLTTMIISAMGTPISARYVDQQIWHGVILRDDAPLPLAWRHQTTRDLVGRSMGWSYRDDMTSQHIFGSPYSIAWVILQGPGTGLLGTAPCRYFKINDHVYLYTWIETRGSGQQGIVLMNTNIMHDVGTFYGIHHGQEFEFYTYGARGYNLGSFDTQAYFKY